VCDRGPLKVGLRIPQVSFERIRQALPALPVQEQELHLGGRIAFQGDPCSPVPDIDATVGIKTGDRDIRVRVQTPESGNADRVRASIDATLDGVAIAHVGADAGLAHRATMTALLHGAEPPDVSKVSSWLRDWKVDVASNRVPLGIAGLQDIEGSCSATCTWQATGRRSRTSTARFSLADGKVANVTLDRARVAIVHQNGDLRADIDFGFGGEGPCSRTRAQTSTPCSPIRRPPRSRWRSRKGPCRSHSSAESSIRRSTRRGHAHPRRQGVGHREGSEGRPDAPREGWIHRRAGDRRELRRDRSARESSRAPS
jgi:hypothetical protein